MTKKHNYPKTRKPGSGGARPGAGAPKKDPTTTLAYRVPAAIAEPLDKRIREVISEEKVRHFARGDRHDPVTIKKWAESGRHVGALDEISRKVISAHLDKETAEVRKLKKQKKRNETNHLTGRPAYFRGRWCAGLRNYRRHAGRYTGHRQSASPCVHFRDRKSVR